MAARIVAIANQKGGVGKTTTTLTLGHALAEAGKKVLVVDLDPQASLTLHTGLEVLGLEATITQALGAAVRGAGARELQQVVEGAIRSTSVEGMDLLPANLDLSAIEVQLFAAFSRERVLARVLGGVAERYEVILIDCPPALGLFTINALTAAQFLVVPVATDFLSLRGAQLLLDQSLPTVQAQLNPQLALLAILPTLHDERTNHGKAVLGELRRLYGETTVMDPVKNTVRFKEAANAGISVIGLLDEESLRPYRMLAARVAAA
jgi:chromosome partitioning protein